MRFLRLSGRCCDGAERDGGSRFHAVPDDQWKGLCGAKPGKRSAGWSSHSGIEATCPKCIKKMGGNYKNLAMPFVKAISEAFGSGETLDEFAERIMKD